MCARVRVCVRVCALGNAQHAARNAFIEKNNMQLLLLAVKEKYYTIHLSFALFLPSPPCLVTDYMHIMHSHNGQSLQHVVNNK